jgi:GGDEF domain-containing protein
VDYLTKPFDVQELRLRIRNALRRADRRIWHNPITGLPEGRLVEEQLKEMLASELWGLVMIRVRGLEKFRDQYGFVAADDVARAVSLMIGNAVKESPGNGGNTFIGHTDTADFVVVTEQELCQKLAERCRVRLEPSVSFFYPAMDRQHVWQLDESERLVIQVGCLSSRDGKFKRLSELGESLNQLFPK